MNHGSSSDYYLSSGSDETGTTQATVLHSGSQVSQLGRQSGVHCPGSRNKRRDARCRKWIEECVNSHSFTQASSARDPTQEADREGDGDEEAEDGNEEAGDDGEGDSSTWWLQLSSREGFYCSPSISLSSHPPRTSQIEAFSQQWPYRLALVLDVAAGLTLLLLLGEEDSETLLLPLFIFMLYLLLTLPLATVIGGWWGPERQPASQI
ncbi:uncharacterized protein LOC141518228 [Macrotis lagotis]|uniref:uncharacterized protein LOC141518228 n=1 Tax=Macrotis lagotis TaxID=92651 RepID=UPI003D681463